MAAYRTEMVIEDPNQVVLSNLPFRRGDQVEITVAKEMPVTSARGRRWAKLFKEIDKLQGVKRMTEEEVAEEIARYRAGK